MKTKPFLLATAGSTVDGRVIDEKMIEEMASSYDPKTYGARLNIEHIRGISGQAPFRAYGDVLELSVGETEVNFNGQVEKRKALYGVFDVTEEAKQLNAAGQKVYPSIEIEPNFGGKGFAYLMGCALTDSPAAIATERLAFNRQLPGTIILSRGAEGQPSEPTALEFAEASESESGAGFLNGLKTVLDGFAAKFAPAPKDPPQDQPPDDKPQAFDFAQMRPLFEDLGKTFATSIESLRSEFRGEIDQLGVKLKKLEADREETPSPKHLARPAAAGANGQYAMTDC
jgi:Phage capsid scaffolding protein (GPO) serine peptidase.